MPLVAVCEMHKEHATLNDFLSDEGWNKISKHLRESGKGHFMKSLTTLDWEPHPQGVDECLPF